MNTSNCIETATTVVFLSPQAFLDACGTLIDLVVCNNTRNHFPIHYTFTNDSGKTLQNKTIHFVLNHHNVVAGESKHCVLEPNPASDPVDAGNEAAAVTQIYELIHDKMRAFSNFLFPNMFVEYPAVNKFFTHFTRQRKHCWSSTKSSANLHYELVLVGFYQKQAVQQDLKNYLQR